MKKNLSTLTSLKFGCAHCNSSSKLDSCSLARTFIPKLSTLIFQLSTLFLTSCSEVLLLSVEQMLPPEVMPQHKVRSVGVVSNFSQHNVVVVNDDALIVPCDADTVKEQVALTFANSGIMDRVVVLDSLLYHPDSTTQHVLTQSEVNALCHEMDVEMIYSIDYACLTFNPAARFISRPLNAYLCSRIYIPDNDSIRGTSILDKETLDYWVNDTEEIAYLAPQIPHLLAQNAIAPYLPSWKERERVFYYDRLCYELREAKVYVRESNWEAAAEQWRSLAESKLRPYRFMAAYNLALYYEMTDDIDAALHMLDTAKALCTKKNRRGEERSLPLDTTFVEQYREVLKDRKKEIERL